MISRPENIHRTHTSCCQGPQQVQIVLGDALVLRAYLVNQTGGTLTALDHRALRWVDSTELLDLPWVPADRAWLPELRRLLVR